MKRIIYLYRFHTLFLLCVAIVVFFTYKHYGIAWDEIDFITYGKHFVIKGLDALAIPHNQIDEVDTYFPGESFIVHKNGHGFILDSLHYLFSMLLFGTPTFEHMHLVRAIIAMFAFVCIAGIAQVTLNKKTGFFAMCMLLLFPRFYGDMYVNAVDVPTLVLFAATVAVFLYVVRNKLSPFLIIVLSVLTGAMVSARVALLYVPVLFIFFGLVYSYIRKTFSKTFLYYVLFSALTVFFLHLFHPYLWERPVAGLLDLIFSSQKYQWNATVLHGGNAIPASKLPVLYIVESMLITIPESTLFLFFIGHLYIAHLLISKNISNDKKVTPVFILFLFYTPLLLLAIMRPVMYDMWRHLLFLTVPIIIIASYGLYALLFVLSKNAGKVLFAMVLAGYVYTAITMFRLHPYEYVYFNSFAGGLSGAYLKYETDYWGMGYKEAVEWFREHINGGKKTYNIIVEGDPISTSYFFSKNMKLTTNPSQADYFFSTTRWNLHERYGGATVHTVSRLGVPLVFIKKLK